MIAINMVLEMIIGIRNNFMPFITKRITSKFYKNIMNRGKCEFWIIYTYFLFDKIPIFTKLVVHTKFITPDEQINFG